jgi:hypothetical protein
MHHLLHLLGDIGVIHLALDKISKLTKQNKNPQPISHHKEKKKKKKNPLHTNKVPEHKIFNPRQQGGKQTMFFSHKESLNPHQQTHQLPLPLEHRARTLYKGM